MYSINPTSIFLVTYAVFTSIVVSACNHNIVVNNRTGNDVQCMKLHAKVPCKGLNASISKYFSGQENITVTIETDVTLSGLIDIENARNITFCGKNATQ